MPLVRVVLGSKSDLAACERQYEDVDRDLRRQLCGEVRPPD